MLRSKKLHLAVIVIAILAIIAIIKRDTRPAEEREADYALPEYSHEIRFSSANLPSLSAGGHYVLWASNPGQSESIFIKRFQANKDCCKSLNGDSFTSWRTYLPVGTTDFFITIENETDRDRSPSNLIFLSGKLEENKITMRSPIAEKLKLARAEALLATPTDGNKLNENSGIWFVTAAGNTGLQLPDIGADWIWEATAQHNGKNLDIGRFTSSSGADNFDAYSLKDAEGYHFPGEDFLRNIPEQFELTPPIDLTNNSSVLVKLVPIINGTEYPVPLHNVLKGEINAKNIKLENTYRDEFTLRLELIAL